MQKLIFITFFIFGALAGNHARLGYESKNMEYGRITRRERAGKPIVQLGRKLGEKIKKTQSIKKGMDSSRVAGEVGNQKISGESSVISTIQKYFGKEWQTAVAICDCESRFNHLAVGDTSLAPASYGLFQIRAFEGRAPVAELLTIEGNIKEAKRLYDMSGWSPWSCAQKI
jgi:hypothetical protein